MGNIILRGVIDDKGQLQVDTVVDLPPGPVEIEIRSEVPSAITSEQILASDFVGMWADRDDLGDSIEYARHLRQRASRPQRDT
ncbi:MAG: hypothetical protein LCI00_13435 [Chloroflexi bacterium]|nr:hypothetical protein [Chloroflexota bacterium]MCC6892335.1 hypothetical protein [Anaerolineae bacterium]